MHVHDEYRRKPLEVKAQAWDGTHIDAHFFAAWVISHGGHAVVDFNNGTPSVMVRLEDGKMQTMIENIYVAVLDADAKWRVMHQSTFGKYYEPIEKKEEAPDGGSTPESPSHALAS